MELLTNGDFATGDFTGWLPFPSGDQTIESGTARLNNNVEGAASIIKQERIQMGLLTAGQEVTISFDDRGSLGPDGVIFAEIFSEIDGGKAMTFLEVLFFPIQIQTHGQPTPQPPPSARMSAEDFPSN